MKKIRKHIDLFNNRAIICFFIFVGGISDVRK